MRDGHDGARGGRGEDRELGGGSAESLRQALRRIDGRGYPAYKELRGAYDFPGYVLLVDHVQGDPFAAPSRVRVRVPAREAGFPAELRRSGSREIALRDFLTRRFGDACGRLARGERGSGKGGLIAIDRPGQEVLERTSVLIAENGEVEARFVMGLPAFGRSIAARDAQAMFFDELPRIVEAALRFRSLDAEALRRHVETIEDADVLRAGLRERGLVAFVAEGAVLPRASGIDPRPLRSDRVVPFTSPPAFRVEVDLPNRGRLAGMGVPGGVTLIVGGGYHGKSTLLRALQDGVYDHVPGDGRELVVTDPTAVKIRAEDGRRVAQVDISPFISNLPFGRDTTAFSSEDASGSTSQAANIVEALEVGARLLLIDEDTSATNFMIRDHRMQELVGKELEPITPFVDKVRQLHAERGVSTILVIGGSGDYLDVADRVICMVEYAPVDVGAEARAVAQRHRTVRRAEGGARFGELTARAPLAASFDARRGRHEVRISARGLQSIDFGTHHIDLGAVEQLVDPSQTRAVGDALHHSTRHMDGRRTIGDVVALVLEDVAARGLDALSDRPVGDRAAFRPLELAAAMNRLRTLAVRKPP